MDQLNSLHALILFQLCLLGWDKNISGLKKQVTHFNKISTDLLFVAFYSTYTLRKASLRGKPHPSSLIPSWLLSRKSLPESHRATETSDATWVRVKEAHLWPLPFRIWIVVLLGLSSSTVCYIPLGRDQMCRCAPTSRRKIMKRN